MLIKCTLEFVWLLLYLFCFDINLDIKNKDYKYSESINISKLKSCTGCLSECSMGCQLGHETPVHHM